MATAMRVAVALVLVAAVVSQADQCSSVGGCPNDSEPQNAVSVLQTELHMNVLGNADEDASVRTSASLKEKDQLEAMDQKLAMQHSMLVSFQHKIAEHPHKVAEHPLIKWLKIRSNGQAAPESEQHLPLVDPHVPIAVGLVSYKYFEAPTHSNFQVLMICLVVIAAVSLGWILFAIFEHSAPPSGDAAEEVPQISKAKLLLLCASFGACSWGMNVVNKTLIYALQAPALVTGAQMLMTVLCSLTLGWQNLKGTRGQVMYWSFIPLIFFGMLVSSFFTFHYLTLSMLMIIRNMGPLITFPIESCVMPPDKVPTMTRAMLVSLLVVFASAIIYCHGVQTSTQGLLFALMNMVLAIADRVSQRRLLSIECKGLTTETCMLLNNSIGLIPTILLGMWLGEFAGADVQEWFMSINTLLLILSGVIGAGICYFALAVQREISATSFMVLQNAVRVAVVVVGVLVFLDPIEFPWQAGGLIMSFSGALWYGWLQNQVKEAKESKEASKEASK